jgi:drug/metabolite transporter (DMT)-like permease
MIYLLLCIISSTLIFVIFKFIDRFKVSTLAVIIYNYLIASITGFVISAGKTENVLSQEANWLPMSIIIGVLFIVMFFVIGKSSQKAGISVTTVASKMSVVSPIIFSIIIDPRDDLTILKIIGILIALTAVFLTIYKKRTLELDQHVIIYPIILFFGMGVVDSLVKLAQLQFIADGELAIFTAILFFIAFLVGIIYLLLGPERVKLLLSRKAFIWGSLLGLSNFGSIFFIIKALNFKEPDGTGIDSSIIFGVNNTGIVIFSVLVGYLVFKEKLQKINYLGIFLALIAIVIFSYA